MGETLEDNRQRQLQELLSLPEVQEGSEAVHSGIEQYLRALSWVGTSRIDPSTVANTQSANWDELGDDGILNWLRRTAAGTHTHCGVYRGIVSPTLIAETEWAFREVDRLSWLYPEGIVLFGMDRQEGKWLTHFEHWVDYDSGSRFSAVMV